MHNKSNKKRNIVHQYDAQEVKIFESATRSKKNTPIYELGNGEKLIEIKSNGSKQAKKYIPTPQRTEIYDKSAEIKRKYDKEDNTIYQIDLQECQSQSRKTSKKSNKNINYQHQQQYETENDDEEKHVQKQRKKKRSGDNYDQINDNDQNQKFNDKSAQQFQKKATRSSQTKLLIKMNGKGKFEEQTSTGFEAATPTKRLTKKLEKMNIHKIGPIKQQKEENLMKKSTKRNKSMHQLESKVQTQSMDIELPQKKEFRTGKYQKLSRIEEKKRNNKKLIQQKQRSKSVIIESQYSSLKKTKTSTIKRDKDVSIQTYIETIEKLQEYSVPDSIPCRDSEKQKITDFLRSSLDQKGSTQTMYMYGVPGIGKTLCYKEVLKKLFVNVKYKDQFRSIIINGLNLSSPEHIYQILCKEITGIDNVNKAKAVQILNHFFEKGRLPAQYKEEKPYKQTILLLLDELDYLVTNDQNVLYNLFEWTQYRQSKLVITAISNTSHLPNEMKPKIKSRMGEKSISFSQYNPKQISEIIQQRLGEIDGVFEDTSLKLICAKIAQSSSDIRRTLQICRNSVEKTMSKYEDVKEKDKQLLKVTSSTVQEVYNSFYNSPYHKCIQSFGKFQKLLLIMIALEVQQNNNETAYFSDVYSRFDNASNNFGFDKYPKRQEMKHLLNQLSALKIINVKEKIWTKNTNNKSTDLVHKTNIRYYNFSDIQINLAIEIDDITNAFNKDEKDAELFRPFKSLFNN